ncbi:cyclin-dependent kinase A-2 isoform X1 [Manihot esculenta]|nr:cyclin-dependent kinase A-2 isoform X1 [Manihot esculenta]KAG8633966.1 hypothetical protein MANES_17G000150v8 [Manihot esculenta]
MDEYDILERLGSGGFGVVWEVIHRSNGTRWAMKRLTLNREDEHGVPPCIFREACIMRDIHHPNIARLEHCFIHNGHIYFVMELLDQTLSEHITRLGGGLLDIKSFLRQILEGVAHCHSLGILHRDLKLSNLMLKGNQLKIIDFGLARGFISTDGDLSPQIGTYAYMAPEILLGSTSYAAAADMWSVGCIFAEMVLRDEFVFGNSELDVMLMICKKMGLPNEEIWPGVSSLTYWEEFMERISNCPPTQQDFAEYFLKKSGYALDDSGIDLLLRLLTYNPAKRISASEALNHPYLHT